MPPMPKTAIDVAPKVSRDQAWRVPSKCRAGKRASPRAVCLIAPALYMAAMFSYAFDTADPATLYADLLSAARGLVAGESDGIANMANLSALIWQALPDLNWAGFYRLVGDELVLGPFQGKAACIRIPLGKGVCGAAAAARATKCVADVHAYPGHIACDAASRSELVVPIVVRGRLIGVLDLDSPRSERFTEIDVAGCEALIAAVGPSLVS